MPTTSTATERPWLELIWIMERDSMSLVQLRERTGIALSTLSNVRSGKRKPTAEQIRKIAETFRLPYSDMLGPRR